MDMVKLAIAQKFSKREEPQTDGRKDSVTGGKGAKQNMKDKLALALLNMVCEKAASISTEEALPKLLQL